jgi:hypothetical protein
MAEAHSIVVYVAGGAVQRVAFCDCCPPVLVEIRTYESDTLPLKRAKHKRMLPQSLSDGRWRDHEGTYGVEWYESPSHALDADPPLRLL